MSIAERAPRRPRCPTGPPGREWEGRPRDGGAGADAGRPRRPTAPPAGSWLDHLSQPDRQAAAQYAATETSLTEWGGRILLFLTHFVLFVGFPPMQHGASADAASGSLIRQVSFLGLAALSVPFLLSRWQTALAILARSWALLLVFAALAMTTLWSQFPDATIKRFVALFIVVIVGLAIAAALPRPRAFLTPLALAYALVLLADLGLAFAVPSLAYDSLGLAGLHPSKNVAGMVGQAMAITFAACMIGVRKPLLFWGLAVLVLLSLLFLALTESKTALGLTILFVFGLLPALAFAGRSVAILFLLGGATIVVVGGITFATGALQLSGPDWATITTGDPTFTNRDDIWIAALNQIRERPWFGYGFGAVWSMLPEFSPLRATLGFWSDNPEVLIRINQSHNGYLDVMQHGGFFLAAFVLLFIVATLAQCVASLGRRGADRWTVAGNAYFLTFFISFLFSNLLESTMFFPDGLLGQVTILCVLAHASWQLPREDG